MTRALLALVFAAAATPSHAQEPSTPAAARVAAGDSAFARGDSATAAREYSAALEADPWSSRATYQLARLQPPGGPDAIRLFRRYTELEPTDAWGYIALGQALVDAGRPDDAAGAFEAAVSLAPQAREARVGLARALALSERTDPAIAELERWLDDHPDDADAWGELARQRTRAERHREAEAALRRAAELAPSPDLGEAIEAARARAGPAVTPLAAGSRDSDGNRVAEIGGRAEAQATDRLRLGASARRIEATDALAAASTVEAAVTAEWRPRRAFEVSAAAGAAAGEPMARLRARWTAPAGGPTAELRLRREPLTASPALLLAPVVLGEARVVADLPLAGPLLVRGLGRVGRITAPGHANGRLGWGGGPVVRLAPASEVGAIYQELTYDEPAAVGYFAPARVQMMELASYVEWYRWWPVVVALDVGGGVQRVTRHGAAADDWRRALRLWSLLSWAVRPGREVRLEVEGYESVLGEAPAPDGGADPAAWRYGSARLSLVWSLR